MLSYSFVLIFNLIIFSVSALYGPKSDVLVADDKTFKDMVLKDDGIVIVEFFAPWFVPNSHTVL